MAYYGNITLKPSSNYTLSTGMAIPSSATWTTATSYTLDTPTYNKTPNVILNEDGIKLNGETDLMIGGRSIKKMLDTIESRLALLEPNPSLEKEWEELKRLGDEYRALEKEIQEKMKTWDILKK